MCADWLEPIPRDELELFDALSERTARRDELISQWEQQRAELRQTIAEMTSKSTEILDGGIAEATRAVADLMDALAKLDQCLETNAAIRRELEVEQAETKRDLEQMMQSLAESGDV